VGTTLRHDEHSAWIIKERCSDGPVPEQTSIDVPLRRLLEKDVERAGGDVSAAQRGRNRVALDQMNRTVPPICDQTSNTSERNALAQGDRRDRDNLVYLCSNPGPSARDTFIASRCEPSGACPDPGKHRAYTGDVAIRGARQHRCQQVR